MSSAYRRCKEINDCKDSAHEAWLYSTTVLQFHEWYDFVVTPLLVLHVYGHMHQYTCRPTLRELIQTFSVVTFPLIIVSCELFVRSLKVIVACENTKL